MYAGSIFDFNTTTILQKKHVSTKTRVETTKQSSTIILSLLRPRAYDILRSEPHNNFHSI